MAQLNVQRIKKLKLGELIGTIATVFCGASIVYFIIGFSVGTALNIPALRLSTLIAAPLLMTAGAGGAAFCNIKFGGGLDKLLKDYIRDVFIENAALMHPERDSLTFYMLAESNSAEIRVNSYKEKIIFDFLPFGRLSAMRRSFIAAEIVDRLSRTFVKLTVERGAKYKSVAYVAASGRKKGRQINIIVNGEPEKRALKNYLKSR